MLRRVAAVACLLAVILPAGVARAAVTDEISSDAAWILSTKFADGAIPIAPNMTKPKVVPYQANFAAMGLARATKLTGNKAFVDAAWQWLHWYAARAVADDPMRPNKECRGIVYDYEREGGSWKTKYELDSSDSYAGTFLIAAKEAFLASGDAQKLRNITLGISRAIDAIECTEQDDGLHFAKPDWPFKYTMDEAETYEGLLAAAELGLYLGDTALRTRAQTKADHLIQGAGALEEPSTGLYLWAKHQNGSTVPAPLDWIYPGGSVQAWAVAHGLATGEKADTLMNRYAEAQPNWDNPNAMAQYYNGVRTVDYWPHVAMGFLRAGQVDRACRGVRNIRAYAVGKSRAYPFTPGHAGQIIVVMSDPQIIARSLTGC
jgi:hypothetical protein